VAGTLREMSVATSPRAAGIRRAVEEARRRVDVSAIARWVPLGLIGLAGLTALWTRLVGLNQSMWNDEVYSVVHYITPGPSAIFSGRLYVPNDHPLFELLSWATVHITGIRSNQGYRFWGVVPALAAIAIMTWWLRRRLGEWVAAAFAVVAVCAPVHLIEGTQARGYGLAFLAAVLLVIGAVTFKEERSARSLAVAVIGTLLGTWTLPVFAVYVAAVLVPLLWFGELRRTLLITLVALGLVSLLFYASLLNALIASSSEQYGLRLGWDGFFYGPLNDQVAPGLQLVLPNAAPTLWEWVSAGILGVGVIGLWRRRAPLIAVTFLGSAVVTYLVMEIARFYVAPRFAAFVLLPMLAVGAIGLVEIGGLIARIPGARVLAVLAAIALSILLMSKIERVGALEAQTPIENFQAAASILSGTGFTEPIVTNSEGPIELSYYLGGLPYYKVLSPTVLNWMFCTRRSAFIFVEDDRQAPAQGPPTVNTSCLAARHAVRVNVPQQWAATLAIWFIPAKR
jgi:hypothetical protein